MVPPREDGAASRQGAVEDVRFEELGAGVGAGVHAGMRVVASWAQSSGLKMLVVKPACSWIRWRLERTVRSFLELNLD